VTRKSKAVDFEASMEELEAIVERLEHGDLSLEATMRLPQAGGLGLEGITVQRVPLDPPDDAPDAPRRGEVVRTDIEMG